MDTVIDKVELIIPFKAEYVSTARLAVSGIATRIGFDIEIIEDIKVAVSEVCNKLVEKGSDIAGSYSLVFNIYSDKLNIQFKSTDPGLMCIFDDSDAELGISIINAFMDDVEFCSENGYILSMTKAIGESIADGQ